MKGSDLVWMERHYHHGRLDGSQLFRCANRRHSCPQGCCGEYLVSGLYKKSVQIKKLRDLVFVNSEMHQVGAVKARLRKPTSDCPLGFDILVRTRHVQGMSIDDGDDGYVILKP